MCNHYMAIPHAFQVGVWAPWAFKLAHVRNSRVSQEYKKSTDKSVTCWPTDKWVRVMETTNWQHVQCVHVVEKARCYLKLTKGGFKFLKKLRKESADFQSHRL